MLDESPINGPVSPNAHLGIPSPDWRKFYREYSGIVPKLVGTPNHLRKIMVELKIRAQTLVPSITTGLNVRDTIMPTSDGSHIKLRIYTPTSEGGRYPALVYIHGGGWTLGDLDGEDGLCRALCVKADTVVVSIDWRLAPEFPFPTGLEDSWEGLQWVIANANELEIDARRVIVAGSSSGGNTAAVLAHRARDRGVHLIGQILRVPATCHIDCYPPELQLHSLEEMKDAPLLSKRSMELFWGYYAPPDPSHPDVSPLLAKSFNGLAPAYIQIAGHDPLRDEGLAYAKKLKEAGVAVDLDIYPGLPHAFGYFPELPAAARNSADLIAAVQSMTTR